MTWRILSHLADLADVGGAAVIGYCKDRLARATRRAAQALPRPTRRHTSP